MVYIHHCQADGLTPRLGDAGASPRGANQMNSHPSRSRTNRSWTRPVAAPYYFTAPQDYVGAHLANAADYDRGVYVQGKLLSRGETRQGRSGLEQMFHIDHMAAAARRSRDTAAFL